MNPGTRLGPYEITAALGVGGMGEVYKARDTRLDRTVAIKILPRLLASDPQFRERFDREARAISQLDHPHICALYDVGQQDGTSFLVMQYLEGETLADRLQKGALPLDQALEYAMQIADALAKAHRAGIVHRDLKPGNIMITRSGARLLDFGLATTDAAGADAPGVSLMTTPAKLTAQGTIVGTFQYMAPEQIEEGRADARSDIWAFGCVLYEMLAGARPFTGKSHASLIANILNAQPTPLADRQPPVTRSIDHITRRCLEKDPDARWQSMVDVGHELRWAATVTNAPAGAPTRPLWRQPYVYAAALLLALAAIAVVSMTRPAAVDDAVTPSLRLTLVAPAGLALTPFGSAGTPHFALSPDGSQIAFVASAPGRAPSLWVRRLDSRVAQEIAQSDDAESPFWSPDGRSIGFFAQGKLRTIGLQGERPSILATILDATGGTWNGEVILVGRVSGPIVRLPSAGGATSDATVMRPNAGGHRWPQFLPDGQHFIYTERWGSVMMAALGSPEATELVRTEATGVYAPPGFVLFAAPRADKLMAQQLGQGYLPVGSAREVLDQVRYAPGSGYPPVSVSTNGLLAYWDGTTVSTQAGWFDRKGTALTTVPAPAAAYNFAIAPNGRQVAYARPGAPADAPSIWLMDPSGGTSRFSFASDGAARPIWAVNGQHVSFSSSAGENLVLLRRPVDGSDKETVVGTVPVTPGARAGLGNYYATDWTRDGRTALVSITSPRTARDIAVFSVDTGRMAPLFESPAYEIQARFSPDNRWIAYATNATGRWEVVVEPFPPTGSKRQVSADGGSQPVWRQDGKELFFLAPDRRLMAVAVDEGASFVHGPPQALFETRMRPTYPPYPVGYDVTPDGQRFLIASVRPDTGPNISIVTNWTAAAR